MVIKRECQNGKSLNRGSTLSLRVVEATFNGTLLGELKGGSPTLLRALSSANSQARNFLAKILRAALLQALHLKMTKVYMQDKSSSSVHLY
jgi:hypothetical protein